MRAAIPRSLRAGAVAAVAVGLAAASLSVAADASKRQKVALGDYQAVLSVPADGGYKVGVFSVAKTGAKLEIVASDRFAGIFYPDAGACDDLDLPLAIEAIPISRSGRFQVRAKTPTDGPPVRVNWKGHWSEPGVASGTITIRHDGCKSTERWRAGKVEPAAAAALPD